jgi:hypothetical protein
MQTQNNSIIFKQYVVCLILKLPIVHMGLLSFWTLCLV